MLKTLFDSAVRLIPVRVLDQMFENFTRGVVLSRDRTFYEDRITRALDAAYFFADLHPELTVRWASTLSAIGVPNHSYGREHAVLLMLDYAEAAHRLDPEGTLKAIDYAAACIRDRETKAELLLLRDRLAPEQAPGPWGSPMPHGMVPEHQVMTLT